MKVDFFSFDYVPHELKQIWKSEIALVVDSGVFIGGNKVQEFEETWGEFTGAQCAIGVSNGLDGLILALRALEVGEGDLVIVPAHTFIATWNAVIAVGATPIGVDVDKDGLMDFEQIRNIKGNIKAVIPVHMHGTPVDIKSLSEFLLKSVSQSRVHIIEDASQAHGATNPDGTKLGEYSDAVVYSLYPTKNLGALGDAGVVTTKDYQLGQKIRVLRNYGSREGDKYTHEIVGFNNRLDPIQASILLVNLRMLSKWNAIRRELCNQYISKLSGDIEILQSPRVDSVRHHFCILSEKRDSLREFLRNCGVMTEIHYPKAAGVEVSKLTGQNVNFPNSERIAKSTLSLPLSQWHSLAQINYVVDKVLAWSNL